MAIAFSRSLRSLQADGWRATLIGLMIALVLLMAWCSWFFFTSIDFTVSGTITGHDDNGFLIVQFPSTETAHIKRGQQAQIIDPNSKNKLYALVTEVENSGQVKLAVPPRQQNIKNLQHAQINIVWQRRTPAQLVLSHIGLSDSTTQ